MNVRCLVGLHEWEKRGGPRNMGHGKFEQCLVCRVCGKIKYNVG
jgi:hypothetical protein